MSRHLRQIVILATATAGLLPAEPVRLSMEEAILQALDRNFAIRIERFEPEIAREEVRLAAGQFDPVIESEYLYENREYNGYEGDEESASFRFGVGSRLPWGTQWEAMVEANDRTSPFDTIPARVTDGVSSFAGIVVTQPILRNFGKDGSYADVRIARESVTASWEGFRAEVMDIVEATIIAYQSLHLAQENLRIAERNRDLAMKLLDDNRKRVKTGAMAPLDIVQAESEAALREVSVISARSFLVQARNTLKGLIWDDPGTVLGLAVEIMPPAEPEFFQPDLARDYQLALAQRPEYRAAEAGLSIREIELRRFRRNALPRLDLVGSVGRTGFDDDFNDSLDTTLNDGDSSYSIGAVFSLPFPNRSRSAGKTRAYLQRNQAELGIQQLEQSIRLGLDDAATQLEADWERIRAARKARQLAEKSLAAEEKKLQVGTSSTFVVLRLQGDLAVAEIREINALTDYAVSLAAYHRLRGKILQVHNIELKQP